MKEVLISLLSGIIGVLITIGYQHFLAPPQSFTFIIEGEEVEVTQSEYMELAEQLKEYENKITDLQNELDQYKEADRPLNMDSSSDNNVKKDDRNSDEAVSIITLETFQGSESWWNSSDAPSFRSFSDSNFIDTYGNEYPDSYVSEHYYINGRNKFSPTYLLDGNYSKCEGKIAWSKSDKNRDGSIWIEFYSEDELIYKTDPMVASDRALSFEFDVEGVEKLTVVKKATRETGSIYIIYPYFNLVK